MSDAGVPPLLQRIRNWARSRKLPYWILAGAAAVWRAVTAMGRSSWEFLDWLGRISLFIDLAKRVPGTLGMLAHIAVHPLFAPAIFVLALSYALFGKSADQVAIQRVSRWRVWLGWSLVGLFVTLTVVVLVTGGLAFRKQSRGFHIQLLSEIADMSSGPWTHLMAGYPSMYGYSITPIQCGLFVRVTNLQWTASSINTYSIEQEASNATWVPLGIIPLRTVEIFYMSDRTRGTLVDFTHNGLEYALAGDPLKPNHTASGWVLLQTPGGSCGQTFRVALTDTTGLVKQFIVPQPKTTRATQLNPSYLQLTNVQRNLAGAHLALRYPYP